VSAGLGVALVAAFGLVAVHRGLRSDVPGSVMAAGMIVMALGMAGIGPTVVHGPWWAAGFAAVAVWPLARPPRSDVCGAPLAHLLGGVAMAYMCALPAMRTSGGSALTADTITPAPTGHETMAGMGPIDLRGAPMTAPGSVGDVLALVGWALACYFLLGAVTALTRRNTDNAVPLLAVVGEAGMRLGTAVMLIASV
jgi:hypothetical protein